MAEISLVTLNARYTHASFGLRYLRANLGAYKDRSVLREFVIKRSPIEIAREILKDEPRIVGFGVYIWNTDQTLAVVQHLRQLRPDLMIVAGGPEISYETEGQPLFPMLDFLFKGEADFTFRDFIANWFEKGELPSQKVVGPQLPDIKSIHLPYEEYTDEDLKNRTLYVEASRGCPYKCEYCLSSLDVSVRNFDTEQFLAELERLIQRGARQFKFVDRTFNLSPSVSSRILTFFLERMHLGLFLHFEMVPDRLPADLRELIRQFPAGSLQFEIGIQTWNPIVARNVSRRQDYTKIRENLLFLSQETGVHTHADLIVGLPGETWESFEAGFNELSELSPDEIQVGILKRLKGTPIVRHDQAFQMRYSMKSPFQILSTKDLNEDQIRQLEIFAEFWDLTANSGRFTSFVQEMKTQAGKTGFFQKFFALSQDLYVKFGRTHSIHLRDLSEALGIPFVEARKSPQPSHPVAPARQQQHLQSNG